MRDPWFPLVVILVVLLAVWLGIAGPIVEVSFKAAPADWLGFGGNLLAAACTLIAAFIAWRVVQPQLSELRKQSAQRQYEQLRSRARELEDERLLVYRLTAAIDVLNRPLLTFRIALTSNDQRAASILIPAVTQASGDLSAAVDELRKDLGPMWGSLEIQNARSTFLNDGYRYTNLWSPVAQQIAGHVPITAIDIDRIAAELAPLHRNIFGAGGKIHDAIDREVIRIGEKVAALERELL